MRIGFDRQRCAIAAMVAAVTCLAPTLAAQMADARSVMGAGSPAFEVGAGCEGGITYDDGTFENGYGWQPSVLSGEYVMRLELPGAVNRIDAVCVCWQRLYDGGAIDLAVDFNVTVYSADGPGGAPGALIDLIQFGDTPALAIAPTFVRLDLPEPLEVEAAAVYIGAQWFPTFEDDAFFICGDESGPGGQPAYGDTTIGLPPSIPLGTAQSFPGYKALGVRAEVVEITPPPPPEPPAGPWLATAALPGYEFKVRITNGATVRDGTLVSDCVPETLCVAGALKNRTEVFVRIIGPRGNGFLWPQVIRFTVAQVEVWARETGSAEFNYYELEGVGEDSDVLNGLVDRDGFLP